MAGTARRKQRGAVLGRRAAADQARKNEPGKAAGHAGGASVSIITSRLVPDSPPHAWPGLPSIWRTFAFGLSLGNDLNVSFTGSKRTIALAPKSVSQTLSLSST